MNTFPYRSTFRKVGDIARIVLRNVFIPSNVIIGTVVGLLLYLHDTQEGFFLGLFLSINTLLSIIQEISAWAILERLELLMMLRVHVINSEGIQTVVLANQIKKGDMLQVRVGDQMPADGIVIKTTTLDVNEALITGEAQSFPRVVGDAILAGSIVTAGDATVQASAAFVDSRMARMTQSIRKFSRNASPIQAAINIFFLYMGLLLLLLSGIVVLRAYMIHESAIVALQAIGALVTIVFPQGLVFTATLIFTYGASRLFKKNIILQEINAVEKLGRIKNLCLDKTGTLTENDFSVETTEQFGQAVYSEAERRDLIAAYITGSKDSSQTIAALRKYVDHAYDGVIDAARSFSSERQYGAVQIPFHGQSAVVVAGAPDILLPSLKNEAERQWLKMLIAKHASLGKRVFCFLYAPGTMPDAQKPLDAIFSIITVCVLENKLRPGIEDTVRFFQDRDITLRIISGDNPETVQAIAHNAGIHNASAFITGAELDSWSPEQYESETKKYIIFARIKPEQKEKIIEALKKDGFTAMVGDGANDALAIKKADLGIAMFDSAFATRHIASIVLRNNSFIDFPEGIKLADRIIENMEIYTAIFFNQTFIGALFFGIVTLYGYNYPFTPLSVNFVAYFIVAFPSVLIFSWILNSSQKTLEPSAQSFLKRMVPFPFASSIIQSVCMAALWIVGVRSVPGVDGITFAALLFILVGFIFFLFTPRMYGDMPTKRQQLQLLSLAILEGLVLWGAIHVPLLTRFFDIKPFPASVLLYILPFIGLYGLLQYALSRFFLRRR